MFKVEGKESSHGLKPGDTVKGIKMGKGWLLLAPKGKNLYLNGEGVCRETPKLKFTKEV